MGYNLALNYVNLMFRSQCLISCKPCLEYVKPVEVYFNLLLFVDAQIQIEW